MTANSLVCSVSNLNVAGQSLHSNKTVECQLEEIFEKIAATEANIYLFNTLIGLGLATNDVKNFVAKQTIHKRVSKAPDSRVQKAAMKSKLVDACAFVKRLRQQRDCLKRKLARKYLGKKSLGRRILYRMVLKYKADCDKEIKDRIEKINHFKKRDRVDKIHKKLPDSTRDLLSEVNLFLPNQITMKPEEPAKPFICDPTIKLDENELAILAKGPKFMIREELTTSEFNLELETMIAKKKYDSLFEDDCQNENGANEHRSNEQLTVKNGGSLNFKDTNLKQSTVMVWEENSGKMLYDMKSKTLNLANMQATAYKHNKEVFLPNPESPSKETSHEFRKREMLSLFDRASKSISDKGKVNSNLSTSELKGLKSLRNRISKGELLVVNTDKSKRFCILSPKQYLESGSAHTDKDLEIDPHQIKKIQTVVNNHTWWAKEILQCGANWGHSDRMSTNLEDNGDQVCKMTLLIKDHKKWSPGSEGPPPSRPVISGNNGLNCHLSELISSIIEPVAYEENGKEIDSTDDMIAKIEQINEKIKSIKGFHDMSDPPNPVGGSLDERGGKAPPHLPTDMSNTPNPKKAVRKEENLNKNDIRAYMNLSSSEKSLSSTNIEEALVDRIETLRQKRNKENNLPEVTDRLKASWLVDKLIGEAAIKLPGDETEVQKGKKQMESGLAVVGADVCSLFPSLKNIEVARMTRIALLDSKVEFADIDYLKALRYLNIVGGNALLDKANLLRLKPKWKGKREDLLTVGGDASRDSKNWRDTSKTIFDSEKRRIIAFFVEILVTVIMGTHVYEFAGRYYVQVDGGPIGLRSTACLASLIMKIWDCAWQKLLEREEIESLDMFRYVDDVREFARPLLPGVRWTGEHFVFKVEWEKEDLESNLNPQQRTTREFVAAMLSLV